MQNDECEIMNKLKIVLCDLNEALVNEWKDCFEEMPNVEIVLGNILEHPCDAIVSPANSFGFMDGGIDYHYSKFFGWGLQNLLQEKIKKTDEGELLVGKSMTLETKNDMFPYLISAPTMRVPMNFQIPASVNAYLGTKAALIAAVKHQNISSLAIPGMCTGCGRMPVEVAANQMLLAYKEVILGQKQEFDSFGDAQRFQNKISPDGMIWTN